MSDLLTSKAQETQVAPVIEQSREYAFAGGYVIGGTRWDHGEDVEPHTHDYIELALVIRGTARHTTQHRSRTISRGDVVVVRPGSWHTYTECQEMEIFNIFVGHELIQRELAWIFDYPALALLLLHGGQATEPLDSETCQVVTAWLDQLVGARHRDGAPTGLLLLSLLGCVLAEFARVSFHAEPERPLISAPVRTVLAAMASDPAQPWTLDALAALSNVSASYLRKQFRTQIGITPLSWLSRYRAERCATLLVTGDDTVSRIGRRVGWSDPNYASRRFRQIYGITPTEYRDLFAIRNRTRA